MFMITSSSRPGITTLVTVMVLGSVALLISLVISLRAGGEADASLAIAQGQRAEAMLIGCSEEALLRLSEDRYFGVEGATIAIDDQECFVSVSRVPGASLPTYAIRLKAVYRQAQKCALLNLVVPNMQLLTSEPLPCTEFEE